MAEAAPDQRGPLAQRLLSLSGVVPLGAFLIFHLWLTSSIAGSREIYDRQVGFLHGSPVLTVLEVVLVLLPLAYHGIYGVIRSLQPRDRDHAYDSDLLAMLQRASGVVVLVFVALHVWEFRGQTWTRGLDVPSYSTKLVEHLSSTQLGIPWIALGYLLGTTATLFHLVNGMTSFLTTWGFTRTAPARQRARQLVRAAGAIAFVVFAALIVQIATGARFFPAETSKPDLACGPEAVTPPPPPHVITAASAPSLPLPSSSSSSSAANPAAKPAPSSVPSALPGADR